jgi:tyrosinase
LEGGPHNYIHGFVGGDMGGYHSPLDPVFWTHHNMIECCWYDWNINRKHANTNDPNWLNFTFTENFVHGDGSSVDVKVVTTLLMPIFYRFEPCFPGKLNIADSLTEQQKTDALKAGVETNMKFVNSVQLQRAAEVRLSEPVKLTLDKVPDEFRQALQPDSPLHPVLTMGDVTLPTSSDFYVRVFVDLPEANAATPTDDPHYAGSFAFFVDPEHLQEMGNMRPEYFVDLTDTVRRLQAGGRLTEGTLDIQLVAVPVEEGRKPASETFTLEFLELGILNQPATQSS